MHPFIASFYSTIPQSALPVADALDSSSSHLSPRPREDVGNDSAFPGETRRTSGCPYLRAGLSAAAGDATGLNVPHGAAPRYTGRWYTSYGY